MIPFHDEMEKAVKDSTALRLLVKAAPGQTQAYIEQAFKLGFAAGALAQAVAIRGKLKL